MHNFKILIIIGFLLIATSATAGTILLLRAGQGASGVVPPSCSNSLDFTDSCNSQYITVI